MAENEQDPPPEAEDTGGNCEPPDCSSEPMETAPTTDQSEAVHDSINNELVPEIKNEPSVAPETELQSNPKADPETELKADPEADPDPESDPVPTVSAGDDGDIPLEDLEDGELSSDDGTESPAKTSASNHKAVKSEPPDDLLRQTSVKEESDLKSMSVPDTPNKRKRKSTESSEDQKNNDQVGAAHSSETTSSSDEEVHKSERKKRKKEKERKKKEKKQKRKREKKEREERKRRKKHGGGGGHVDDGYDDEFGDTLPPPPYADDRYNSRYDDRWRGDRRRTYSDERMYDDYEDSYRRSPPPAGPYDSPPPDPYASPPDDSSDDEFSETLYSMVGDELMDPNVSAAEKEALFARKQASIPGLSASKMKKIIKKKRWQEQLAMRERDHMRRRSRRDEMPPREKTQKCKFYAEGKCQKGERCQFSHNFIPAKKMEACKFFLQGYCAKGDMCIYLHSEVPCKYYHTGQKCFNADKCKFSHEPLTDSTKPLLEKAILLEETGTFKPENKPSLLGSPPKESRRERDRSVDRDSYDESLALPPPKISTFDPDDDVRRSPPDRVQFRSGRDRDEDLRRGGGSSHSNQDMGREMLPPPLFGSSSGGAMSLFDLTVTPSADLQQKLDAGLYDELTAPLSESDDDRTGRYDSPPKRPKSFYTETLVTPDRRERIRFGSDDGTSHPPRRNRWGPDLPNSDGGRDNEDRPPKAGLLPLPGSQAEGENNVSSTSQQAQQALSKILQALRHGAVANASTASSSTATRTTDPRNSTADPRSTASDPRAAASDSRGADPRGADPRSAPARADPRVRDPRSAQPLLPDPRSAPEAEPPLPAYDPRADPRTSTAIRSNSPAIDSTTKHSPPPIKREPLLPAPPVVKASPPELDGKLTKEMTFKLHIVDVLSSTLYIPPGAENSQELLRDPRIKKRVESMKSTTSNAPPSLPDITADLQRMQNAMMMSNSAPIAAKSDKARLSRTSSDSSSGSRRTSVDKKMTPTRGQGDQNSNSDNLNDSVGAKARNAPRTIYSKINQEGANSAFDSTPPVDEDDEEEDSLKIDMTET